MIAEGSSEFPAFGLVGALLATAIVLAGAVWIWRRTRRARGVTTWAAVAGLTGLAAAFLTLFFAGMRHYGGTLSSGSAGVQDNCAVWWTEAALPSGQKAEQGDLSPTCRHDAIAAIGPALLVALLIGLAVAMVVFATVLLLSRRRLRRGPRVRVDRGTVIE